MSGFTDEALAVLLDYDWPGNVRELKNLIEATFIYVDREISSKDFPESFHRHLPEANCTAQDERTRIITALFETNGNKVRAAQKLNWSRMTLYRKMAKYGVDPAASMIVKSEGQMPQVNENSAP